MNILLLSNFVCVLVLHAPVKHGPQRNVWKIQIVTRYMYVTSVLSIFGATWIMIDFCIYPHISALLMYGKQKAFKI